LIFLKRLVGCRVDAGGFAMHKDRVVPMALKIQPVHPDRGKIELEDDSAARHWVKTLGAPREAIAAAVEKVGANPETVRKELAREAVDREAAQQANAAK
jgi:hypothetical protein